MSLFFRKKQKSAAPHSLYSFTRVRRITLFVNNYLLLTELVSRVLYAFAQQSSIFTVRCRTVRADMALPP